MNHLKRYVYRIFIPTAIVVGITIAVRIYLNHEFAERNVRPVSSTSANPPGAASTRAPAVDKESRKSVLEGLWYSKEKLDRSLEVSRDELSLKEEDAAERAAKNLAGSIERLSEATSDNWERLRKQALDRLETYAQLLPSEGE